MDFYLSVKLFFNVLVANLRDQLKPEAKSACEKYFTLTRNSRMCKLLLTGFCLQKFTVNVITPLEFGSILLEQPSHREHVYDG